MGSKLGEARFLNTRMLEANAAAISKSDLSLSTGTAGTKTKLENAASSVYTTVEAAKVATQAKVDALYAKTERNAIKIQQAKEESLRLQTTELEAKLEMQRSLAEHQTLVQNRFQSKRFDVYKLNALKQDKLKQEFARSRFTLNQLLTSNGPTVDTTKFKQSTCTRSVLQRCVQRVYGGSVCVLHRHGLRVWSDCGLRQHGRNPGRACSCNRGYRYSRLLQHRDGSRGQPRPLRQYLQSIL